MRKLTLIGGAPMTGKTTLSRKIVKEQGAIELSTDSIRSWMKNLLNSEDNPKLFYSDGVSAEEFYQKFVTPQSVIDGELAEGEQVEKGVVSLLKTAITWDYLIIEGIAITPKFAREIEEEYTDREVEIIILVDQDSSRIEERIRGRGLWGPLETYPDYLIPKEVEWVILYNKWFEEQAKKYKIPVTFV